MDYKWTALGVVGLGTLMGSIDSTVLIIAFPAIATDLSASLTQMVWVIMIYVLMSTAFVLSFGRVADLKGRKRLYLVGFLVFTVGSALCGVARSGDELIAARALQGIGSSLLVANSFAILADAFPVRERGRAFGINAVVWSIGGISGVVLGGFILSVTTWQWIFWINVPIGAVAIVLGYVALRESASGGAHETFDFPAAIFFTAALSSLLLGVTEGIVLTWSNPLAWVPLLVALPLLAAFVIWELRVSADPILPFSLFRRWVFTASLTVSILQGLGIFAINFLLMIYFQGIRHIPVLTAAYLLVPLSVTLALLGPVGGRLSDRYGARIVSTIGLLIQAGVLLLLAGLASTTPLWVVAAYEGLYGIGGGLFFPANTAAIMSSVPRERYGVASGAMMTFRNGAMAMSFVVALVALTASLPSGTAAILFGGAFTPSILARLHLTLAQLDTAFLSGMRTAFLVAAGLLFASAGVSIARGREGSSESESAGRRWAVRGPVRTPPASPIPPSSGPDGTAEP
jgi:EmrB/QacA subfamily drug resistance transporter